jgi:hypothetical protein
VKSCQNGKLFLCFNSQEVLCQAGRMNLDKLRSEPWGALRKPVTQLAF